MAQNYYVRLNGRGGYKRETVLQVTTYTREVVTGYPGNMYRDTGLAVTDAMRSDGIPLPGSPIAQDDIFNHTAPKQETKERFAHIFKDASGVVVGFYWDDYVAGVTNSNA